LPIGGGCERYDQITQGIALHMKGAQRRYNPQASTGAELDIMKEKAESLGRIGAKLDEIFGRLKTLQDHIRTMEKEGKGIAEINDVIADFNEKRKAAFQYLHYLIIQREAMGFRRHAHVQRLYKIPAKKRPVVAGNGGKDCIP
jgi:hypothetical protein